MTSGEASDLQWLLSEIDRLPDGPGAKAGVMEILCRMVGLRVSFRRVWCCALHGCAKSCGCWRAAPPGGRPVTV